ncbi:methylated-DNA--protein-cysteine methyltransferase Ogt [Salinisphaera sp. PC39]|uniref:methylated-DNA--[protein]-cysteine S-methyltransferase n=1 Tax=Salinisphaera sp. PC39 TaxID=1304156 RepID=UPI003340ED59
MRYTHFDSPVGRLLLARDARGLRRIGFPEGRLAPEPGPGWERDDNAFDDVREQLQAYFDGRLTAFDLPLAPVTTPFQGRVLAELRKVPYGRTVTYGELARRVGNPRASRAVGMANGRNPLPIVIPCHRVIGADGSLTGFGGGIEVKRRLLKMEEEYRSP